MAINKKLIHFKSKLKFNEELANGNILETSIVFILDTTEIYTHGLLYDGSKVDLSNIEEMISKIKTDGDGFMYLNDKGEYEIPLIIVDSEEKLNSITPEIGTRAVVRNIVEGYDNLNLAKILNGEETNVPADLFEALDKYAVKVTSVDTSILFPYLEGEEHTHYELFTLTSAFEQFTMFTNLDGSSITMVYINSFGAPLIIYVNDGYNFNWYDHTILERIITMDNIMSIINLSQNVVDAFLLFSTALNVSIIANNDYTDYYYTSKGWVLSGYATILLLLLFVYLILDIVAEQTPTRVSQLENDANYTTASDMNAKQDTLISGTNIKTINGESILGSGDITISGGSSSGCSGAYVEVNHGTSDTTFILTPNTFHIWDEVVNLTLTFGSETSGVANEYLFQFTSGATATTLTLPDDIKWVNDSAPTIMENRIYQVSVLKGLASCLEFNNTTSTLITFIVGDTQYNAELNMNWLDWAISKYNVDSFVPDPTGIFVPSRETYVVRPDETGLVSQSDLIISNAQYFYMD